MYRHDRALHDFNEATKLDNVQSSTGSSNRGTLSSGLRVITSIAFHTAFVLRSLLVAHY